MAAFKPHAGQLVIRWVTTSESQLLYVVLFAFHLLSLSILLPFFAFVRSARSECLDQSNPINQPVKHQSTSCAMISPCTSVFYYCSIFLEVNSLSLSKSIHLLIHCLVKCCGESNRLNGIMLYRDFIRHTFESYLGDQGHREAKAFSQRTHNVKWSISDSLHPIGSLTDTRGPFHRGLFIA